MKRKQQWCAFAFLVGFGLFARPVHAQIGGAVPDLSGFADEIASSFSADPKGAGKSVAGGVFKSGLSVPSVKPGAAAQGIGKQLREALEKGGKKEGAAAIETEMPETLKKVEAGLEKIGFAKRDMGVAVAYAFIYNWETATGETIPEKPSMVAAKNVAAAIGKHWGPKFDKMTPESKEKIYESLLISTTLFSAFAQQFEKAGKTEDAASIRKSAGQMFQTLIGVPPAQVKIDAEGRITGLAGGEPAATGSAETTVE
ncbi:MAG: hypothetical protein H7145_14040 [Akkermansiaceae bacterium]|nr:hypothetical protein [Armatimonadota bacterium]